MRSLALRLAPQLRRAGRTAAARCVLLMSTDSKGYVGVKPSLSEARTMPREYFELDNDVLLTLALSGDQPARQERLVREVMAVDDVEWEAAMTQLAVIKEYNRRPLLVRLSSFPYKVGVMVSAAGALASIPLVFDLNTAIWFNEAFVTTDVPPPEDLETWLETGSWTWNWMEPVLGQISFMLLCLAFSRAQMVNIGWKPYTAAINSWRANRLSLKFPMYNRHIIRSFAKRDHF